MKNSNGITLIALAITIIIMMIIASVSIYVGNSNIKDAIENKQLAELGMIQQTVLEAYTKYQMTRNEAILVGEVVPYETVESLLKEIGEEPKIMRQAGTGMIDPDGNIIDSIYYDEPIECEYYRMSADSLKKLGITETDEEVTYIVNYSTGEVINETTIKTTSGKPLYIYTQYILKIHTMNLIELIYYNKILMF
ncbi:MAG: hypothetical protein HFJ55_00200 [Clostridia bacterium]|nr:hypothetical protein [Clostridia bacterium]